MGLGLGAMSTITDAEILDIARQHEAYAGAIEPTVRGTDALVEFARQVIAADRNEFFEPRPLEHRAQPYSWRDVPLQERRALIRSRA